MKPYKNQNIVILLWCLLLILSWLLWLSPTIQSNIVFLMNMLYFYLPICIAFTISFMVYSVAVLRNRRKNTQEQLPKGIKIFLLIIVVCCFLFAVTAPNVLCPSTAEKEIKFYQSFSLKNLISENYNENELCTKQKKGWGDTFYIHSVVLVNTDKLTCADEEVRNSYLNPIINYDVQYIQHIPPLLQNHMAAWLHTHMKIRVQNCAFADSSQIQSFDYKGIQFLIYYDKYQDFKTERLIFCAEHESDMLLFSLILEDETNQLNINQEYILEKIADFMQKTGDVHNDNQINTGDGSLC